MFAAGFALLLALAWFGLRLALNHRSDTTYAADVFNTLVPQSALVPRTGSDPRAAGRQ